MSPNAAENPSSCTTTAPNTGPTARARLKVAALRAMAPRISCAGTSSGTSESMAGVENALTTPSIAASATTTGVVASPAAEMMASDPVMRMDPTWVTIMRRRRS